MYTRLFAAILLLATGLLGLMVVPIPACARGNELPGTMVGAALGGLLGSQFGHGNGQLAYTGLGVFMGGMVGNSVGQSMDRTDYMYSHHACCSGGYNYGYAAPQYSYYQPTYVAPPPAYVYSRRYQQPLYEPVPQVEYRSPVYVEEGYIDYMPPPVIEERDDYCREFTQQVRINGRMQESYGTACLQPDGSWRVAR